MSNHRKQLKSSSRPRGADEFQVGPGMVVDVEFIVTDEDGQTVPLAESRREFVFGFGELLPRLEVALDGAIAGDERCITLSPSEAFGARDPSRILEVERGEFPPDVREGDTFELENAEGKILVMRVLEVSEDGVKLDSNHPLAGQRLGYKLMVRGVRPASAAQLAEAERRALLGDESEPSDSPPCVEPESLVRSPGPGTVNRGATSSFPTTTDSDASGDSGNEAER